MMSRSHYTLVAPNCDSIAAVLPVARGVSIIAVTGDLDDSAATRLLHWREARLHLLEVGQADIRHLVVDMSRARRATASAVAILDHARTVSARRHVGIQLVGAGLIMAMSSAETRRYLGRWSTFPALESARAALDPSAGGDRSPSRPVDPNAILLTAGPPHDHLG
jgi:hypothetical protein